MPLAALYRRVSTDHQENSLVVQEAQNDEYCRRLELEPTEFTDEDVSGGKPFAERPGGRALLAALAHTPAIRHIVTAKQDRVGRDTLDVIATIRRLWELGIIPHFTAEGGAFPRTPQNELLMEIKASVAQYERNLICDRTRTVLRHKFAQGELTGKVPFGYRVRYEFAGGGHHLSETALSAADVLALGQGPPVRKPLVDHPAEQALLHRMHAWRQAGWAYLAIAQQLNAEGVLAKHGGRWHLSTVQKVLTSRHAQRLLHPSPGNLKLET